MFSGHQLSLSHAVAAPSNADILQLLPPRDIATDRNWMLWTSTCGMCFGSEPNSENLRTLVAQTCQPSRKRFGAKNRPSKHLQHSSSSAALLVGRPLAFCVPPQHVDKWHSHPTTTTTTKWVNLNQSICLQTSSCLSHPGFHHLLEQRAHKHC